MSEIDELEKLAQLHKAGAITDEEFQAAKGRLLAAAAASRAYDVPAIDVSSLDPKWQRRFQFFSQHGSPFSREATAAFRQLSTADRMLILMNGWAFLFGIIYFFVLGIPKRGLGLGALGFIAFLLLQRWGIFTASPHYFCIIMQCIFAATANYYYFIKVTEGRDSWDPLRDLRPRAGGKASGRGDA